MAGTAFVGTTPFNGNVWMQGLLWGTQWDSSQATVVVDVYIAGQSSNEFVDDGFGGVTATNPYDEELAAMRMAMASFEEVCNIDFREVGFQSAANLIWASVDDFDADGALGWAWPPGEADVGLVAMNWEVYDDTAASFLAKGGFDYCTFIHELGHAVGLAHPHDNGGISTIFPGVTEEFGDLGNLNMNQGIWTMMSYNDGWETGPMGLPSEGASYGYQAGPMALDIAVLQWMYGVDTTTRAGNSTYDLPRLNQVGTFWSCIWDAGGVDLLRGASDRANTIDLRPATLQNAPGGGGYASYASGIHGGFTIAKGALIENATGGRLADKIQGNGGVNVLDGRDGNDSIAGARGNDQLYGGNGVDQLSGGDGIDRVLGGAGADRLHGGGGDDDFVYKDQADSTLANRDSIMDFQRGRDDIDLSAIDARSDLAGNQAFRLDTGGVFAIGEIRQSVVLGNLFVGVNLDNDAEVEMSIRVMGLSSALAATDFLL